MGDKHVTQLVWVFCGCVMKIVMMTWPGREVKSDVIYVNGGEDILM